MADYDLKENDDGTFTLTLYALDLAASPTIYSVTTASARDTVYLLDNLINGDDNVNPT